MALTKHYSDLASLWLDLHIQMCGKAVWRKMHRVPYTVTWLPWKAFGPSGFGEHKLTSLRKWYFNDEEIDRAKKALDKATSSHWDPMFCIAVQLGNGLKPDSPLRYKQGQCMLSVVLRVQRGQIWPLIVWRTTEITRRLIADWVVIEQLFLRLEILDQVDKVDMLFNTTFLANFHCPLLAKWVPGIQDIDPQGPAKYIPTKTPPKYKSREIAWNLAAKAEPMFTGVPHKWKLRLDHVGSDFPKEPNNAAKS